MKALTNDQYQNLKEFAKSKGMGLCGYQSIQGGVLLNNSVRDGIYGKTIWELKDQIILATLK